MDCSTNGEKKRSQGCVSLKCSIIISYIVSIISNVLLIFILYLTGYSFKWIGYIFHFMVLFCCYLSIRHLSLISTKSLKRYRSTTKYYSLFLIIIAVFYFIVIIYMFIAKTNMDVLYYFAFCMVIWCAFHWMFISIIYSFIKTIEDRPAQKNTPGITVDKKLRDLMLSN